MKSIPNTISPWQDPMRAHCLSNTTPLEYSFISVKWKRNILL